MTQTIQAGKLICFSEGEYSDYGYAGHFLTLEEVGPDQFQEAKDRITKRILEDGVFDRYGREENPKDWDSRDWNSIHRDQLISELVRMGRLMVIDCYEFYLGSYGELDL